MVDLERAQEVGTTQSSENTCVLRWSGITKTVKIVEDNAGLLKSSIANKPEGTAEANLEINKNQATSTKVILRNISGSASPGEILALMGPSGSGKTSLLDSLSGRSAFEQGTLTVNGVEVEKSMMKKFKRKIAYVKQSDVFFDHLSVRDQLTYTALLRLPSSKTREEKENEVNRIINLLRLQKCADTPIRLLSGGEKKRVSIGTELLTDPQVILLDEPTSGLDSTSAVALLRMLHNLAKEGGKTIITSIHQPNSSVFRAFNKLIMLAEGSVVYFGTPMDSLTYLNEKNLACPSGYNAADHWMDLLVVDTAIDEDSDLTSSESLKEEKKEIDDHDQGGSKTRELLISSWDDQTQAADVLQSMKTDIQLSGNNSFLTYNGSKFNTSWLTQFYVLTHRAMRNSRSAVFTTLNILKSGFIGILMGLVWYQIPYTERTVQDRSGFFFFTMTYWVFDSMFIALMSFPTERNIIFKERASGSYRLSAYFMAKSVSEIPAAVALPTIYMIIAYWIAGINNNFWVFLGILGCALLSVLSGSSIGLLVGASVMDLEKAMVILVVVALLLYVLGGFLIQNALYFMTWFKYVSPFKYAYDASRLIVFNRDIPCDGSGALGICEGNVDSVTPEELFDYFEIKGIEGSVGFNVAMLIILFIVPRYFAYLSIRRKKGEERMY